MPLIPRVNKAADQSATTPAPAPAPAPAATPAPTPAASTSTVVAAAPAAGAVSTKVAKRMRNPIKEVFKDKMKLEWNTLHRIMVTQGNFVDKEDNNKAFGGQIVVQMMSFQESWQISPGTDDPSDGELVRYSDDGITTNKGEDCKEYLQELIASGRTQAKMSARYQMALVIEATPNDSTGAMVGKIVQIDLSTTSKNAFDQFMTEIGYKESRGLVTEEAAESGMIRMTAKVKTASKAGRSLNWTQVAFELATA